MPSNTRRTAAVRMPHRAPARAWPLAFSGVLIVTTLACTHRPPRDSSSLSGAPQRFVARFQTLLQPPMVTRASGGETIDVAISPDGSRLAYVGRRGSTEQLYTRALGELDVMPIPGTEDAVSPFFSPDGNWVGFGADDELRKVSLAGGRPQTLCAARGLLGASWGSMNSIVFSSAGDTGLQRVSADGGVPVRLTMPSANRGEIVQRAPQLLP